MGGLMREFMFGVMGEWIDGWIYGWIDGWMD